VNLLNETIEALREHGKAPEDTTFVSDGQQSATWEGFRVLAETCDYDNGFGAAEINMDLVVVGVGWWLERYEYDGAERWEFKTMPTAPSGRGPLILGSGVNWFLVSPNNPIVALYIALVRNDRCSGVNR